MSASFQEANQLLLFERIKNGDERSFKLLYDLYWEPLYIHALIMIEDEDLAKDIIQELFIQLWDKKEKIDIRQSLKSYLYTATRNLVISKMRQINRRSRLEEELERGYTDFDLNTLKQIEEKDLIRVIDTCIDNLPQKMKEVFVLSRKEHRTTKEIAELLGTAETTVKKQLSNSLKVIRIALEKLLLFSLLITFFIFFYNRILLTRSDKRLTLNSQHELAQKK
ncbi:RNA polymerase sigma factor [Sphingobacterium yanglingense]|uniref:RNA polymerase sigma-70 factor (ECF subfamily) n=1 Tax=Sphingobacterium yanglingense TaxID=1437280 RepID=A0A4R6WIT7_9SPHI|nr:RNA polymerase sigma-70 factor [Sphingobacterium yanglingense]TDQ80200.1 RNA polymerase sigma-70 factor (ECF subfamily) [Sphingobacterium yanglingense]